MPEPGSISRATAARLVGRTPPCSTPRGARTLSRLTPPLNLHATASRLRLPGVPIATNPDANYPAVDELLPAGGAVATYVGYAAERPPDVWVWP